MLVAACLSFADRRPDVDQRTGEVTTDERTSGLTDADAAALELALRCGSRWAADVVAVTVGPPEAEAVLREAMACGVTRAVRVVAPEPCGAAEVAEAVASVLGGVDVVWCGDQGLEAGSGAVPAFLAARLRATGAFGLVGVDEPGPGELRVVRRLDGGRREVLVVRAPAVLSVEGAVARLRRAGLPGLLRAERAEILVAPSPVRAAGSAPVRVGPPRPYRPRPRALPGPAGASALERVRALTGAGAPAGAADGGRRAPVVADPEEAATLLLEALARWGYDLPQRAGG